MKPNDADGKLPSEKHEQGQNRDATLRTYESEEKLRK